MVFYNATSIKFSDVNDTFRFFNPKAGLNYQLNGKNAFYVYFGIANKEPRRDDYENGAIKPERLFDYELGDKNFGNAQSPEFVLGAETLNFSSAGADGFRLTFDQIPYQIDERFNRVPGGASNTDPTTDQDANE